MKSDEKINSDSERNEESRNSDESPDEIRDDANSVEFRLESTDKSKSEDDGP